MLKPLNRLKPSIETVRDSADDKSRNEVVERFIKLTLADSHQPGLSNGDVSSVCQMESTRINCGPYLRKFNLI